MNTVHFRSFKKFISTKSAYVNVPFDEDDVVDHISKRYTHKGNRIEILLYQSTNGRLLTKYLVSNLVFTVNTVIDFFGVTDNSLSIFIVTNNNRKVFPEDNIIDARHVNNAVTVTYNTGGVKTKFVFIYRYEDMYKVLIHELIHYLDKDFVHYVPNKHPMMEPYNIHDTSGRINLSEAYTETMANYIYIVHVLGKRSLAKRPLCDVLDAYKTKFLCIAKSLIDHCAKYDNVIQHSHMFSYYICRALLFADIHTFLELYRNKDTKGLLSLITRNRSLLNEVDSPLKTMHL